MSSPQDPPLSDYQQVVGLNPTTPTIPSLCKHGIFDAGTADREKRFANTVCSVSGGYCHYVPSS
ncbi:MAG: hypothetical protein QOJ54_100 [Aliidongia sp.]|nr:hypothetical protein [Aliidongia sp.]